MIKKLVINAFLVFIIAHFLKGVRVDSILSAIIVSAVLGLLNLFVFPIMVILTLPLTIITFGLFLLVINAVLILVCSNLVDGFMVDTFWTAMLFSIILSIVESIVHKLLK